MLRCEAAASVHSLCTCHVGHASFTVVVVRCVCRYLVVHYTLWSGRASFAPVVISA